MDKRQEGIIHASPEKRYKHCISTMADSEEVWIIRQEDNSATLESENNTDIIIYAEEEFADLCKEGTPEMMDIHDFLSLCQTELSASQQFCVFPTKQNRYVVSVKTFCHDLINELERIE